MFFFDDIELQILILKVIEGIVAVGLSPNHGGWGG